MAKVASHYFLNNRKKLDYSLIQAYPNRSKIGGADMKFVKFYFLIALFSPILNSYSELLSKPLPPKCNGISSAFFDYKGTYYLLCHKKATIKLLKKVSILNRKLQFSEPNQSFPDFIQSVLDLGYTDFNAVYLDVDGNAFSQNGEIGVYVHSTRKITLLAENQEPRSFNVPDFSCDRISTLSQNKIFTRCVVSASGQVVVYSNLICTTEGCTDITNGYLAKNRSIYSAINLDDSDYIYVSLADNNTQSPTLVNLSSDIETSLTPHSSLKNQRIIDSSSSGKHLLRGSTKANDTNAKYAYYSSQTASPKLLLKQAQKYTEDKLKIVSSVQLLSNGYIGFIGKRNSSKSVILVR